MLDGSDIFMIAFSLHVLIRDIDARLVTFTIILHATDMIPFSLKNFTRYEFSFDI